MKRFTGIVIMVVSLVGLAGCDEGEITTPGPNVVPTGAVSTPHVMTPPTDNSVPDIDTQIEELRENNGDIPQEERDRLNNVPVIPDVFDK